MARLKRRRISIVARLRNYFITGIVVLVPIGITLYLTKFFISVSSKLIPEEINPNSYLPVLIPGLEIFLAVIFITFIGEQNKNTRNSIRNCLRNNCRTNIKFSKSKSRW